ncbi:hypothetical protein O3M35_002571 [Rhynocoris fuscipes]|uniref:Uncharacterized protein n=1 Tax=Rhynocoris fuscipes TaxID=488301 RepID=A0AAW1CNB2_9HEMI
MELVVGSREVLDVVDTLSTFVAATCALLRALRFLSKRRDITNILDRLELLRLQMLKDNEYKHFVIHTENIGRKILTVLFISFNSFPFASLAMIIWGNYIDEFQEKRDFLKIWIPWNKEELWSDIFTNLLLLITTTCGMDVFSATSSIDITFALYISACTKILENKLINKGIKNEEIYEQHKLITELE